ncbi:MAG: hypothetical protein K6B73_06130 [Treponema sp.]|nr:hypothetical protein [Treponema sp.]
MAWLSPYKLRVSGVPWMARIAVLPTAKSACDKKYTDAPVRKHKVL